jgi:hypothetical protein
MQQMSLKIISNSCYHINNKIQRLSRVHIRVPSDKTRPLPVLHCFLIALPPAPVLLGIFHQMRDALHHQKCAVTLVLRPNQCFVFGNRPENNSQGCRKCAPESGSRVHLDLEIDAGWPCVVQVEPACVHGVPGQEQCMQELQHNSAGAW